MRKTSKVVCITERRRKPNTDLEPSIPIPGEAVATLHCERTSNRIDFFLSPLFGTTESRVETDRRKANLTILPGPNNASPEEGA
jgi:hypothetical protein